MSVSPTQPELDTESEKCATAPIVFEQKSFPSFRSRFSFSLPHRSKKPAPDDLQQKSTTSPSTTPRHSFFKKDEKTEKLEKVETKKPEKTRMSFSGTKGDPKVDSKSEQYRKSPRSMRFSVSVTSLAKSQLVVEMSLVSEAQDVFGSGKSESDKIRTSDDIMKLVTADASTPLFYSQIPSIQKANKRLLTEKKMCQVIVENHTKKMIDCWSSFVLPEEEWSLESKKSYNADITKYSEMKMEYSEKSVTKKTDLALYELVDIDKSFVFFKDFFYSKDTGTLICFQVVLGLQLLLIFSKLGVHRALLTQDMKCVEWWNSLVKSPEKFQKVKVKTKLQDELILFEENLATSQYKFGVLYAKQKQTTESEFYTNEETSPAFHKFLKLLGKSESLHEWKKYSGGLDTKNKKTGNKFVYTLFRNNEIAFHVAPYIPDDLTDQKLERKRFVGNDVVVLVFKEKENSEDLIDPDFGSRFNNVIIVVSPEKTSSSNEKYRVSVVCRGEVKPFPPFVQDRWYPHGSAFSVLLLQKRLLFHIIYKCYIDVIVINAERMCMKTGTLLDSSLRSNDMLLKMIIEKIQE
ncbi:rap GTPase-activating protein, putative [Entamoeba invadens IP1]|uniref:Rap GTPase-activating protein, putative n=1 Tax=Entamoeba invadens IP1 TaxID=370355 RepID=A0A0A1UGT3_ENTIV|nr:rap GTPase-activating protein, putative [Entamoeba invadens IP1]ELP95134.1 rap GTPase-activating protein, putative [Entamoeba invadens IP1]|eukprot:XP_004261905.1 rap GTPase-activating protein, putative [Entamoeba invadens IP1]